MICPLMIIVVVAAAILRRYDDEKDGDTPLDRDNDALLLPRHDMLITPCCSKLSICSVQLPYILLRHETSISNNSLIGRTAEQLECLRAKL
jgi:hypothetical protein